MENVRAVTLAPTFASAENLFLNGTKAFAKKTKQNTSGCYRHHIIHNNKLRAFSQKMSLEPPFKVWRQPASLSHGVLVLDTSQGCHCQRGVCLILDPRNWGLGSATATLILFLAQKPKLQQIQSCNRYMKVKVSLLGRILKVLFFFFMYFLLLSTVFHYSLEQPLGLYLKDLLPSLFEA